MVCNGQAACQICGMEGGHAHTNHLCVYAGLVSPLVLYHLGILEEFTFTGVDVTNDLYAIQELSDLVGNTPEFHYGVWTVIIHSTYDRGEPAVNYK